MWWTCSCVCFLNNFFDLWWSYGNGPLGLILWLFLLPDSYPIMQFWGLQMEKKGKSSCANLLFSWYCTKEEWEMFPLTSRFKNDICVCLCLPEVYAWHVCRCFRRPKPLDVLELESQAAVSHRMWVLDTRLRASAWAMSLVPTSRFLMMFFYVVWLAFQGPWQD